MPWGWAQMADTPSSAGRVVADGEVLRGQLGAVCVCVCVTQGPVFLGCAQSAAAP